MSTIDVDNLLVSSTRENILAKIIVMETGEQVEPAAMNALLQLFDQHGNYAGIAKYVTGLMSEKHTSNGYDLPKTVAQVMSNATGVKWTTSDAAELIAEAPTLGIDSWPTLFEYMIVNHTSEYGSLLDANVQNYLQAYGIETLPEETTVLPPAIQELFITPKGNEFFATVGIRDYDNTLFGEFHFDAPSMFREGDVNIIDFAGGNKTLGIGGSSEFARMFGLNKNTFFLNFSEGDKVVIINDTKLYPFLNMNTDQAYFDSTLLSHKVSDPFWWPYDPDTGVLDFGESLVQAMTIPQPEGPVLAFPPYGVPLQLASVADPYRMYVDGIQYALNLHFNDTLPDGQVILVGSNSALFGPDNFLFNDPAYLV